MLRSIGFVSTSPILFALLLVPNLGNAGEAVDVEGVARRVHLNLVQSPPEDLDVAVAAAGMRFADFVYGTPDSPRVAIAIGESPDGDPVLYVDRNRNRTLEPRDLVEGSGTTRTTSLAACHVDGDILNEFPRSVEFRWQAESDSVSVGTVTGMKHSVRLDADAPVSVLQVRQIDGNANGQFADPTDLLQVDLNDDTTFDPFLETFPFRPVLNVRRAPLVC